MEEEEETFSWGRKKMVQSRLVLASIDWQYFPQVSLWDVPGCFHRTNWFLFSFIYIVINKIY